MQLRKNGLSHLKPVKSRQEDDYDNFTNESIQSWPTQTSRMDEITDEHYRMIWTIKQLLNE